MKLNLRRLTNSKALNLLPGPVEIHPAVKVAFSATPISHREPQFYEDFEITRQRLCRFVHAENCEIMTGSGTLANECIAHYIKALGSKGLIISNGEFGNRLIEHGKQIGLDFIILRKGWGETISGNEVRQALSPEIKWIWMVHCETSTGVLNPLRAVQKICIDRNIKLCLDTISSIGNIHVNLEGVYLASTTSGKGLGAFPGLAIIFYQNALVHPDNNCRIPRYFDIRLYRKARGIPFTISSNAFYALKTALSFSANDRHIKHIETLSSYLSFKIRNAGFTILCPENRMPAIFTLIFPLKESSLEIGNKLATNGIILHYNSTYLVERNWIQISLMGHHHPGELKKLTRYLESAIKTKLTA